MNTTKSLTKVVMLYIRVDGNAEIGTGHVMRCLSIAHAERKNGGECTFITADKQMKPLIEEQGFAVICLDSVWNDLNKETEKMEILVGEQKIDKLLVDSYFVTPEYLERLHKLTYLIYMDDLDKFIYPCSELINYNIFADKLNYPSRYPNTKLKLGPKYAPLRGEFRDLPEREAREPVQSVLVTAGGCDWFNVAGQFAKKAMEHPDISQLKYHIAAGRYNEHIHELDTLAEKYPNIMVYKNIGTGTITETHLQAGMSPKIKNMAELMLSCDIAVSAGGTTLYELCACSTPTAVFATADNQLAAVEAFSDGYMLGCGDYRDDTEGCVEKLVTGVERLAKDIKLRETMSKRCRELVNH